MPTLSCSEITLHLKITHEQEENLKVFEHYGFDDDYVSDMLDELFDNYLYAQHEQMSDDFLHASRLHYAVMNTRKILRGIAPALKEALKNKQNSGDGK